MKFAALLTCITLGAGAHATQLAEAGPSLPKTPAQERIERAERAIANDPERFSAYNEMAFALARRARETADTTHYERADEFLERSFELEPDNFGARKAEAWIRLGQHRFAEALELAESLNRRSPDDILVYGFLVDANVELGDYDAAEEAAQWMLNLRPGNVPALTRTAYLRELFGDVDGAVDLMISAFQRVDPIEREDRAWILTHIAHLELSMGKIASAGEIVGEALKLFPDYHYALAVEARILAADGELDRATAVLRKRYDIAPHPENLFDLAVMTERAGDEVEAKGLFERFEEDALRESSGLDNANGELVTFYTDHAHEPAKALHIAKLERDRRADVQTRASYSWALFRSGQVTAARDEIEAVLFIGLRDARLLYRAGAILAAAGDSESALVRLRQSLAADPSAPTRDAAMALLEQLEAAE